LNVLDGRKYWMVSKIELTIIPKITINKISLYFLSFENFQIVRKEAKKK